MKTIYSFLFALLLAGSLSAQTNAKYMVRFNVDAVDYSKNVVAINLEVKLLPGLTAMNIADQNYRFTFNEDVVANPRIKQELEVSGVKLNSDFNAFFDAHHLDGSRGNIVSYNVVLNSGKGYPVDDSRWYQVGTVEFDIRDTENSMEISWLTKQDFPTTFVGEKKEGTLLAVAEGNYENLSLNFEQKVTPEEPTVAEGTLPISIYPNPVKGNEPVTLEITVAQDQESEILFTDELGRVVKRFNQDLTEGNQMLPLDVSFLSSGIYFIHVSGKDGVSSVQKLVKIGK